MLNMQATFITSLGNLTMSTPRRLSAEKALVLDTANMSRSQRTQAEVTLTYAGTLPPTKKGTSRDKVAMRKKAFAESHAGEKWEGEKWQGAWQAAGVPLGTQGRMVDPAAVESLGAGHVAGLPELQQVPSHTKKPAKAMNSLSRGYTVSDALGQAPKGSG